MRALSSLSQLNSVRYACRRVHSFSLPSIIVCVSCEFNTRVKNVKAIIKYWKLSRVRITQHGNRTISTARHVTQSDTTNLHPSNYIKSNFKWQPKQHVSPLQCSRCESDRCAWTANKIRIRCCALLSFGTITCNNIINGDKVDVCAHFFCISSSFYALHLKLRLSKCVTVQARDRIILWNK